MTYKNQVSYGLHVIVVMAVFYLMGHLVASRISDKATLVSHASPGDQEGGCQIRWIQGIADCEVIDEGGKGCVSYVARHAFLCLMHAFHTVMVRCACIAMHSLCRKLREG